MYLPEDLEVYFDDIVDKAERIWDQLDNYKEVVEALEQTNESVIQHKQNDILLTLITGILGMNVPIPFQSQHHTFYDIIGIMLAIAIGMLGYFRLKRWI